MIFKSLIKNWIVKIVSWILNLYKRACNLLIGKSIKSMVLKTAYYKPSIINIESLIEYLNSISGKELTLTCIRQNIFKTRWKSRDKALINRCQVKAASLYLNYITNKEDIDIHTESIRTTIADISPIVKDLDQYEDCSFILCSTNTLPSTIHYKHAEWLFYKNKLPPETSRRYNIDLMVLYGMRLSFEKRILGFLGIDYLTINNKPVGLSRILPIVKKLKKVRFDPNINWEEMLMVNNWLNHYMHRHIRPYPWVIHQAFQIMNPLLLPGKIIEGKREYASYYASTFVPVESELESEIEQIFKSVMSNILIKWSGQREILLSKSNE